MNLKRFGIFVAMLFIITGLASGVTYLFLNRIQSCSCQIIETGTHISQVLAHGLVFTPEQKKKLKPLESELSKKLERIQLKLAEKRISMCRLLKQEGTKAKDLRRHVNEVSKIEARQHELIIGHLIAMRDILTPEQKDKFFAAIMSDICHACRGITGHSKCMCGKCALESKNRDEYK